MINLITLQLKKWTIFSCIVDNDISIGFLISSPFFVQVFLLFIEIQFGYNAGETIEELRGR